MASAGDGPVVSVLPPRRALQRNSSSRTQKIFADSRARRLSSARLYIEPSAPPLSRTVWQPASSQRTASPLAHLAHLQANRREAWQEATPTSHTFPHIRPPHRRRFRPRSTVRTKAARLPRNLSQTLLSAYDAARAPFRHAPPSASSRRAGLNRKGSSRHNNNRAQEHGAPRPQPVRSATRTVEISGPLNSPTRSASLGKKLFRQRPLRSALASPLFSHPPHNMPFRRSVDSSRPKTSDHHVASRRSVARVRDSFNRAKIHVRRPPKGVTHWFDALDEDSSDGDYPEVVDAPSSAPPGITTFQPSLGPHRARAAPTSFVSQSSDADYFSYSHYLRSSRRRKNSAVESDSGNTARFVPEDVHSRSILDLSSDDEGTMAPSPGWDAYTPSPGAHHAAFLRRQRKGSGATSGLRQSMATDSKSPRSPTIRQSDRSQPSTASMLSASNTLSTRSEINYIAVTHEEMAVLEMMRRKRAAQPDIQHQIDSPPTNFQESITEEDEATVVTPSPLNPNHPGRQSETDAERSHSLASTVTLESGENITFPTPPIPGKKSPLLGQKPPRGRNRSVPLNLGGLPTPPLTASYWSPEMTTPAEEIAELEAIPYSGPLPIRTSSNTSRSLSSSEASKRTSIYSLLRPRVFDATQSSTQEPETPVKRPLRDSRNSEVRNYSVTTAIRSPRLTRTFSAERKRYTSGSLHMDFSDIEFSPVPNLLSPSLGGLLTSTSPSADWPGSAGLPPAAMTARSPSCASHSPSLTDGASLSGRSRSEIDTPVKDPLGSHPRILLDHSRPFSLDRLAGHKLTVQVMGDDEDDGETLGEGRYAVEIRKLADPSGKDDDALVKVDSGEGKRKASTEVMDAWNALGGYPIA